MYNCCDEGVDGATQYLTSLQSSPVRRKWAQRVTVDVLLSIATNAVLMFRTWSVVKDLDDHAAWPGITEFRAMCSRTAGFNSLMLELAARITMDVAESNKPSPQPSITAPVGHLPYNPPRYNRRDYFNSEEGRRFRLSNRRHLRITEDAPKRCIVCGRICKSACEECSTDSFKAMLCAKLRRGAERSCFSEFHSLTELSDRRARTQKKEVSRGGEPR
mgnify:FL=1